MEETFAGGVVATTATVATFVVQPPSAAVPIYFVRFGLGRLRALWRGLTKREERTAATTTLTEIPTAAVTITITIIKITI